MSRERASSAGADGGQDTRSGSGARQQDLSRTRRPTFYNRAHARAADLAGDLIRGGQDIEDGAFLAIDPRDRLGGGLAIAELVRQGVSARQAEGALASMVAEATRQNDVAVGISWCDAESLRETMAHLEDSDDWPARLSAPLPEGFVRLLMISEGRLTLSLVPYDVPSES
jgi:hypothetical protein